MTGEDTEFFHAGICEVKEYQRSGNIIRVIRLPDRILDRKHPDPVSILEPEKPVYWHYEKNVKNVVIADTTLSDSSYKYVTTSDFSSGNNFRTTIPAAFFNDFEPKDKKSVRSGVPEGAMFRSGELRHFIYNKRMSEGNTRSCYVLTEDEFSKQFSDTGIWDGDLSQVPKFIS